MKKDAVQLRVMFRTYSPPQVIKIKMEVIRTWHAANI